MGRPADTCRPSSIREGYAAWFGDELGRRVWRDERRALDRVMGEVAGRSVLDVGAGEGRLAHELSGRGARVVALDRSQAMLRAAALTPEERHPTPVMADALSNLTNGWADRTIAYASPSIRGVTVNAAAYLDPESEHDYGFGFGYRGHGFEGGLQYHDAGSGRAWRQATGIGDALRGHASFGQETWSVGASWERVQTDGGDPQRFLFAVATAEATPELTLVAAVGHVSDGAVQPVSGTAFHAGLTYALYAQAHVQVLYSRLSPGSGPDRGNLALGLTYHFALRRP